MYLNIKKSVAAICCLLGFTTYSFSQSPTDELMMPKNEICFLLNFQYGEFNKYWEGDFLRENETIATVQRRSALLMAAYGITDKLDVYAGLPYMETNSTTPNGGKFAGTSGVQDLSIGVKYKALERTDDKGKLSLYGSILFSTPVSNYLSDYQPYSLGLGTPQIAWRAIAHYQFNNGFYGRFAGAYVWKGYTEAEREYYYNDGSYYTAWMDVPSSWNFDLTIGKWFFENDLRVEVTMSNQTSTSGDDIRAYNAPQPTNKVDMTRVGGFAHYYFPKIKGLGVLGYFQQNVAGRNAPKMTSFGMGVTYQFGF
ncbi:hypothetical protein [Algoriphagus machipongonensis]|uniref:Outer membrane insertion C- signal n=1 Tax=Algoriphagus machipongonensis TaxID=388413 RepID=A3HY49_9BACT|nr:hypothetical protein [Algoriphagus machipongonensis]EAZ81522.1 putative outer membrane insertion C- signal [Algoriphagus machipongonensis]